MTAHWPVTLRRGEVTLRPLETSDAKAWREVRVRNAAWLKPWDATVPPGARGRPASFRVLVRRQVGQLGASVITPTNHSPRSRSAGDPE